MIDPDNITNFAQNRLQLQEFMSFWILVAGKTAHVTAPRLGNMMKFARTKGIYNAFDLWQDVGICKLPIFLKSHGIGDYNKKAKSLVTIAEAGLDLKTCGLDDLALFGQGQKTRRCFLIHSRPNQMLAGLDVQILKCLRREYGFRTAPKDTPASNKEYQRWEQVVVDIFTREGRTAADFDLNKWKAYRKAPPKRVAA